jgi:DNA excision repair protein ERCC-2
MSGTLEPLDEYRDSIGLPKDARLDSIPSPFPPENRLVLYVDDVTTRYEDIERDETMIGRLAEHVSRLVSEIPKSTIVFYPSYAIMERIASKTSKASLGRNVYFESRGMDQGDFMRVVNDFKMSPGSALLHAISGGRVSEGIDFPGAEMELAILAGIPYPKPTAKQRALQHFCEIRFGDGWDRAVKAPTTRKLQQAIGRLIRSETDRGVAVILDRRAVQFKDILTAKKSDDSVSDVRDFFDEEPETRESAHAMISRSRRSLQH